MNTKLCKELTRLGAELRAAEAIDPDSEEAYNLRDQIADIEEEMNAEMAESYFSEE